MSTTPPNRGVAARPVMPDSCARLRLVATTPGGVALCETVQPVTLIGSRRDCHLPLNDPAISKVHSAIVCTGHAYLVCDLCSRSGTFVAEHPVQVRTLAAGDKMRVGPFDVAVELVDAAPGHSRASTHDDTPQPPAPLSLTIGGQTVELSAARTTDGEAHVGPHAGAAVIGRRSACDIVINGPDVSPAHALVFTFDGRPAIADLGSRSGTFLNGQPIQLAWLHDTDRLTIGGERLVVACHASAPCVSLELPPSAPAAYPTTDGPGLEPAEPTVKLLRAMASELAEAQERLEERARRLDRRAAELDALAGLIDLQFEHIEALKTDILRRAEAADQASEEAQQRLTSAVEQEQAIVAACEGLERWQAVLERRDGQSLTNDASSRLAKPDMSGLPDAPLPARPYPQPDAPRDDGARPGANA